MKNSKLFTEVKDYIMIIIGLALLAFGLCAFILPHKVIIGGVSGLSSLVYFGTGGLISVALSQYIINLVLLAIAFRIVGRTFVLRTIFGASIASLCIGAIEGFFFSIPPLMPDVAVSVILGAILAGSGVGLALAHNGSTGGTDIVAASVARVSNISIGRTMVFTDMFIVASSIFLPFEGTMVERLQERIPLIVYGLIATFVVAFMADMIVNSNKQSTQFIIFSKKWKEIADKVNSEANRGVTIVNGQGWYSKQEVKLVMVWCRKFESMTIFRIVKSVDENAFISQANVNGVYGLGFDQVKVRLKPSAMPEAGAVAQR